jgi:hypothetical protein
MIVESLSCPNAWFVPIHDQVSLENGPFLWDGGAISIGRMAVRMIISDMKFTLIAGDKNPSILSRDSQILAAKRMSLPEIGNTHCSHQIQKFA